MSKNDKKLATDVNTKISVVMNDAMELAGTPLVERD